MNRYYDLPDHPAVSSALRFGYPEPEVRHECEYCDRDAKWWNGAIYLCDDCALTEAINQIKEYKDIEDVCEFVGFECA